MTGPEFSEVDIDRLADYVGGALDGTPDEAEVASLVAGDPAWRAAHDALTAGMASVAAGLGALAAEAMPADIAVRLDSALAGLPPLDRTGAPGAGAAETTAAEATAAEAGAAEAGAARAGAAGPEIAVPDHTEAAAPIAAGRLQRRVTTVGEPRRRRTSRHIGVSDPDRRSGLRRWAGPIAVAAGAVVFAGIGFGDLLTGGDASSDSASTAGHAPAAGENAPLLASRDAHADALGPPAASRLAAPPVADRITSTGTDYQRGSLRSAAAVGAVEPYTADKRAAESAGAQVFVGQSPFGLERLNDRAALAGCLDAIARENGGGPITVQAVDYARYRGAPALVVSFVAGNGTWTWVSGAACGTPADAAATLDSVKVG